jgi:hypothetical protein
MREGTDSNLLSIETFLAHINKIKLLREIQEGRILGKKGKTTNKMLGI